MWYKSVMVFNYDKDTLFKTGYNTITIVVFLVLVYASYLITIVIRKV